MSMLSQTRSFAGPSDIRHTHQAVDISTASRHQHLRKNSHKSGTLHTARQQGMLAIGAHRALRQFGIVHLASGWLHASQGIPGFACVLALAQLRARQLQGLSHTSASS